MFSLKIALKAMAHIIISCVLIILMLVELSQVSAGTVFYAAGSLFNATRDRNIREILGRTEYCKMRNGMSIDFDIRYIAGGGYVQLSLVRIDRIGRGERILVLLNPRRLSIKTATSEKYPVAVQHSSTDHAQIIFAQYPRRNQMTRARE